MDEDSASSQTLKGLDEVDAELTRADRIDREGERELIKIQKKN